MFGLVSYLIGLSIISCLISFLSSISDKSIVQNSRESFDYLSEYTWKIKDQKQLSSKIIFLFDSLVYFMTFLKFSCMYFFYFQNVFNHVFESKIKPDTCLPGIFLAFHIFKMFIRYIKACGILLSAKLTWIGLPLNFWSNMASLAVIASWLVQLMYKERNVLFLRVRNYRLCLNSRSVVLGFSPKMHGNLTFLYICTCVSYLHYHLQDSSDYDVKFDIDHSSKALGKDQLW